MPVVFHAQTAYFNETICREESVPMRLLQWAVPMTLGLAFGLTLGLSVAASAHEYTSKGVTVAHPWARATPGASKVGVAFLELKADAGVVDKLIGGKTDVAGVVELHTHIMENNIAKMRRVDAVPLQPGGSVVFKPSGLHLMLMDLKVPLKEGDLIKITLTFEKAGDIEIDAGVEKLGAMGPHGFDHQPGHAPDPKAAGQKGKGGHGAHQHH
jgi:periplasmic copper chaperone A